MTETEAKTRKKNRAENSDAQIYKSILWNIARWISSWRS